jgi:hypothetical protein
MSGYSDTALAKKLGIKEGFKVFLVEAPSQYRALLAPLPRCSPVLSSLYARNFVGKNPSDKTGALRAAKEPTIQPVAHRKLPDAAESSRRPRERFSPRSG